jgi:hypothetical protein
MPPVEPLTVNQLKTGQLYVLCMGHRGTEYNGKIGLACSAGYTVDDKYDPCVVMVHDGYLLTSGALDYKYIPYVPKK